VGDKYGPLTRGPAKKEIVHNSGVIERSSTTSEEIFSAFLEWGVKACGTRGEFKRSFTFTDRTAA
jgi:hypothetical protein